MYLQLVFGIFWCKKISAKAAHKMLVKMTPTPTFYKQVFCTKVFWPLNDMVHEHLTSAQNKANTLEY